MLQILLHSSKTMSGATDFSIPLSAPLFSCEAQQLADIWRHESLETISKLMHVSSAKAATVRQLFDEWSLNQPEQTAAIDAFRGDIYSGFQAASLSSDDRKFAQRHLVILSGLYGALRPNDAIMPYRLEMGYKLPGGKSMYAFWGDKLAQIILDKTDHIVNLSSVEYTKSLLPYSSIPVVTPKFMTVSSKTGQPGFVTVHAKIARGAFARWMIQQRVDTIDRLRDFAELGYHYDTVASTTEQPVFVCETFKGIGLSVRQDNHGQKYHVVSLDSRN